MISFATSVPKVDGVSIRLHQEVIDRLLVAMTPRLLNSVKKMTIDDFHQEISFIGSADCSNIKVLDLRPVKPLQVRLTDGNACISSELLMMAVNIQVALKMPLMSQNFVIIANLNIKDLTICFNVALDQQHRFVVRVSRNNVEVNSMELELKNIGGETHNKLTAIVGWMTNMIKSKINNFLAQSLPLNINENLEKAIAKNKPIISLDGKKGVIVDLTPTHTPILNDGLTYSTAAYTFQEKEAQRDFKFREAPREIPKFEEGFGVTAYVNDFVLRNIIGVLWKHTDLFTKTLTERSPLLDIDFTVEAFSKLFQRLDQKYPKDLKTKLVVRVAQPPNIKIKNDYLSLFVWLQVDTIVVENGKDVLFGTFSVTANIDVVPSLENIQTLRIVPRASTIVDFERFSLYGVEVDRELINQTVNGAIQLFINYFGFEHKTELAVILEMVQFEKTKMKLENNLLVVAASVSFKEFPLEDAASKGPAASVNPALRRHSEKPIDKSPLLSPLEVANAQGLKSKTLASKSKKEELDDLSPIGLAVLNKQSAVGSGTKRKNALRTI